jgi:hypothetical protein
MGPGGTDAATGVDAPAESPPVDTSAEPSLADLARNTTRYARAWGELVAGEAALARVNLARLLFAVLFIPAIAVGVVLGFDGVLASLLYRAFADWTLAIIGVVIVNLGLLFGVLMLLRHWWRTLSLPRSREALARLWRNHDDIGTQGEIADKRGPG